MANTNLEHIIEALIFSSDRPLSVKQIKDIINDEKETSGVTADIKHIEDSIAELKEKFRGDEYSFMLMEIAGGYRFATKKLYSTWLTKLNKEKLRRRLSQSALETLAIIAYNQPITKSEMEFIRGVNVDYIVGALLEKNLVTIKGRAEAPGRPMLYATTPEFLELLGINSADELPPLKEIQEIIKSGPPEGITQSDIDFYDEINMIKAKANGEVFSDAEKNILDAGNIPDGEIQTEEDTTPDSTATDSSADTLEKDNEGTSMDEPTTELLPKNEDEEIIE